MKFNLYVVLCEDLQASVFIGRALKASGATKYQVRQVRYPDRAFQQSGGKGPRRVDGDMVYPTGSDHVLKRFHTELQELRRGRVPGKMTALVVHIDVDNATPQGSSVADRRNALIAACAAAEVDPPTPSDPVAFLIARRNIETWIRCLDGAQVDEHTDYPKLSGREAEAEDAAESFAQHAAAGTTPKNATDSLARGLDEMRKVL
jgi:hypothetical protein